MRGAPLRCRGSQQRRQQQQQAPRQQQQHKQKQPSRRRALPSAAVGAAAREFASRSLSLALASAVAASSWLGWLGEGAAALAAPSPGHHAQVEQTYEQEIRRQHHRPKSRLPSSDEAAALQLLLDPDLFTPDALRGMVKLQQYAQYVEELEASGAEEGAGCEACAANRMLLEKAWQTVANEYYDPTGRFSQVWWAEQLLGTLRAHGGLLRTKAEAHAALHDLVGSLGDRYSAFLEPTAFRRALMRPLPAERKYLAAQFVGVGVQLGDVSPLGGRLVEAPLVESPAEAAGIRRADRVLEIDGIPCETLTLDETTTLLRGPAGSPVTLLVAPAGPAQQPPRLLELERRPLPQPAVKEAQLPLPDGRFVQYVRLHYFSHDATAALSQVVSSAEADGRVAGYVLDLRNDPGGVFEEAVAISSLFEDPTRPVAETVRSGAGLVDAVWRPSGLSPAAWPDLLAGPLTSKPLALIVNSNTASASEVLAGALRDYNRAVLFGERTFGKGLVQYYFPLSSEGAGLKLTVAKYLTPSSYDVSRSGGLAPDVACRDFPHGVFTPGRADQCVLEAMGWVSSAPAPDPLSFSPLYASSDKP